MRSRALSSSSYSRCSGAAASISASSNSSRSSSRSRCAVELAQLLAAAARAPASRANASAQARRRSVCSGPHSSSEQLQLLAGDRQLAVLVLAVEGHQRARRRRAARRPSPSGRSDRRACGRRRRRGARARSPRRRRGSRSASASRQRVGQVEDALDVGLLRARAARSRSARARRAAGRARARARSCPRRSRRSARSGRAPDAARRARSAAGSPHAAQTARRRSSSGRRRIARRGAGSTVALALRLTIRDVTCGERGAGGDRQEHARRVHSSAHTAWLPATKIQLPSGPTTDAGPLPVGRRAQASAWHEEVNRAGRHGTPLSCLLVTIGNLEELAREHGSELSEQTLAYVASVLGDPGARLRSRRPAERARAAARAARRRRPPRRDRRQAGARAAAHDQGRIRRHAPAAAHLRRAGARGRRTSTARSCSSERAAAARRGNGAEAALGPGRAPRRPCLDGRTDLHNHDRAHGI